MKSRLNKIIIATLMFISFSCFEPQRFSVTTRLATPVMIRPGSPGDGYIWIEGEWFWNGRNYAWRNGYWTSPLRGYNWAPGRWKERNHGWRWAPGRWRR